MKFTYKGEDANAKTVSETVEAEDRYAVYDIARTNGHTVTVIEEVRPFSLGKFVNMERVNYFLSRISDDQLAMATRNLSSMLVAGLPLSRALSVLERQSSNLRMKGTMSAIREKVTKGDPLHEALRDFPETFSKLYVSMVRAGEESGNLAESLRVVGVQLERASNLRKKIRGAMIYPAIIVSVMGIIGILMLVYVMPTITATFVKLEVDLPLSTRILIGTSDFVQNNGLITLLGAIGTVIGLIIGARTTRGKRIIHYALIRMPVIGTLVKETNAARTARTLSSLLTSGVDVIGAIEITRDVVQNVYYKDVLAIAAERVETGNPMSETFMEHSALYPILVGEMIAVGEETGEISKMLNELAIFYENEVEQKTKDLSTIIEPILMVVIGGVVGFFAMAMIAPIYSVSDSL